MARTNPHDLVVTDTPGSASSEESARPTTAKPGPIDWKDHVWPPPGPYGDLHWSYLFRHSVDRFRRMVRKYKLTHVRVGNVVFVESAYLWQQLQVQQIDIDDPDLDEPPPPAKPKRRKPNAPPPRQP